MDWVIPWLSLIKESLHGVPVPGLQGAIAIMLEVALTFDKLRANKEETNKLIAYTKAISQILDPLVKTGTKGSLRRGPLLYRLERLSMGLIESAQHLEKMKSYHWKDRIIHRDVISKTIVAINNSISQALQTFRLEGDIRQEDILDELSEKADVILSEIRALPSRRSTRGGKHVSASFEASSARTCLDGTRTEVLQELRDWASGNLQPHERFCWMHGPPGTGKTTIAKTIADELDKAGCLAGSFFFSRDREYRRNPQVVFPTLARQLSTFNSDFARALDYSRAKHPSVDDAIMETQLVQLVIEPLRQTTPGPMPWVIVLDALDECSGQSAASSATEILGLLGLHAHEMPSHIRILVTSRPEHAMDSAFHVGSLHSVTRVIDLHSMNADIAADDIRRYVHYELSGEWATREGWRLGTDDLQLLTGLADGLFIFASTAVKLINGAAESGKKPAVMLHMLVQPEEEKKGSQLPPLNALYLQILERAFPKDDQATFKLYRRVMGAIAHLKNPLGVRPLASLLGMDPSDIFYILRPLQSVLLVPKDGSSQIRFYHKSFRDFIITPPERVSESAGTNVRNFFFHDQAAHDIKLAEDCFISMSLALHRNMCGSKDTLRLNNSIPDLETRIQVHLPMHARYACLHWALHLNSQVHEGTALAKHRLEHWSRTQFLYWLEALSLTNDLERAIDSLRQAELWYETCHSPSKDVIQILKDGQNFVRTFFDPIQQSAGHIYQSALSFTPDCSLLLNYKALSDSSVKVLQGRSSGWNPFLWSASGRSGWARSVAFSPDGRRIVSGSHEKAVHIWSTDTGKLQTTLHGHDGWIGNAVFSPNGEQIASGSFDSTIRIWCPRTARLLNTIQTDATFIWCVAFSPDGTRIASGSGDNRVRLWSSYTGKLLSVLEGHSAGVLTVAFSPDSRRLASGSYDHSIRLWSCTSENMLHLMAGHSGSILSVAFSSDGERMVSGSSDGTIILWSAEKGRLTYDLNTLKGHDGWVWSVAFSPDGKHLVSGSGDKTVRVWSIETGQLLQTLSGHSAAVFSVAYSPDGTRIASASSDDSVRLWSAETTQVNRPRDSHDGRILAVAFSTNGSLLVSGSDDKTARLWSTRDGRLIHTFTGHAAAVICLSFSPDAKRIATGSIDCTVKIWSSDTGKLLSNFKGHTSPVEYVGFHPDGSQIISRDSDGAQQQWSLGAKKGFSRRYSAVREPSKDDGPSSPTTAAAVIGTSKYAISPEGWITHNKRHIFWIPFANRPFSQYGEPPIQASHDHILCFGSASGTLTILDFSAHYAAAAA